MSEQRRRRAKKKPTQVAAESTKSVWVTPFKNADEVEAVEKDIHVFETEPAYVRVAAGQTVNLGDYESLRVDVAVTVPCYVEMIDETRDEAANWVADKLQDEIDEWTQK